MKARKISDADAVRMPDVVKDIMRKIEKAAGSRLPHIIARWDEIVGADIAKHTAPLALHGKKLTVSVDDSMWMSELSRFHRRRMAEAVNKTFGENFVQDIAFRLTGGK